MEEPRDHRVQSSIGLMAQEGMGWGVGHYPGHPGKKADPPVPQPHPTLQTFAPAWPPWSSPVSALPQGGGDPCVPAGSHGRRHRTARCWGSTSPQAPCWRWPWAPCTMTPSTGRARRPSTLRGEYCPLQTGPGGCECGGIGGTCQETQI